MRSLIATAAVTALISFGCESHNAGGAGTYRGGTNSTGHNLGENSASISNNNGAYSSDAKAAPIGGANTDAGNRSEPIRQNNGTATPSNGGSSSNDGTGVGNKGQGSAPAGGVNANDQNGNRGGR